MLRTHTCGEISKKLIGKDVILCGFVDSVRSHGKITFINLRDRYGCLQIVLSGELAKTFAEIRRESILRIFGKVRERLVKGGVKKDKDVQPNPDVEITADKIIVLQEAPSLPFEFDEASEETRLRYRYLDLRRKKIQDNLFTRYKMIKAIRDYLDKKQFIEIETPLLAKSTPEGARDYLVPSRTFPGKFFALPQSPQLFKQLLMVSGFDKYFQIARCLRDEDLRADRQPEFTQLDIEMSYVEEKDIFELIEGILSYVWKKVLNVKIQIPFERISYSEAIKKYKTDKPDLRKEGEKFKFLWVIDFPLFEYSEEEKKIVSVHHPFTAPKDEDLKLLDTEPLKVRAKAYDLVLNGEEIGGGSIRIHNSELQNKIFKLLGLSDREMKEKFGFLLNALKFAPPHGGIALGLDRLIAIATNNENIRDVIAFPKTKDGRDLMLDTPSEVSDKQLKELGLNF
ncbi:MAG: aspartate--tRNA ligase [Candidatus Aenigmatarchaeota archaeon]